MESTWQRIGRSTQNSSAIHWESDLPARTNPSLAVLCALHDSWLSQCGAASDYRIDARLLDAPFKCPNCRRSYSPSWSSFSWAVDVPVGRPPYALVVLTAVKDADDGDQSFADVESDHGSAFVICDAQTGTYGMPSRLAPRNGKPFNPSQDVTIALV